MQDVHTEHWQQRKCKECSSLFFYEVKNIENRDAWFLAELCKVKKGMEKTSESSSKQSLLDLCHVCISSRRKDYHFQWMVVYLFCRKTWFPGTSELKFLRIAWGQSAQIHGSLGQMAPDSQEQYVFSRKMGPKHGSPRQPKFPRENMVLWSK